MSYICKVDQYLEIFAGETCATSIGTNARVGRAGSRHKATVGVAADIQTQFPLLTSLQSTL